MASVKGSSKKGGGELCRIVIDLTANGAEVTKQFEPTGGIYRPERAKDRMSFDDKQKAADYVEECLTGKKDKDSEY